MTEPKTSDCRDVLVHLYAFHDHELTADEADQIREHLMACEPCLDAFQVEDALRTLIRKCCGQARAPQSFRARPGVNIKSCVHFASWYAGPVCFEGTGAAVARASGSARPVASSRA